MNGKKINVWVEKSKLDDIDRMFLRIYDYHTATLYDKHNNKLYYQMNESLEVVLSDLDKYYNEYNRYELNKYIKKIK